MRKKELRFELEWRDFRSNITELSMNKIFGVDK